MLSFKNRAYSDRKTGVTFAEYARADKPRTLCFFKFSEAGCRRAQQMSTGHNRGQGKAIIQKRVILPRPNGCRCAFAARATAASSRSRRWNFSKSGGGNFGADHSPALSGISKPGRADGELLSGSRDGSRRGCSFVIERGRNVADANDADQAVIVDDRQMADMVLVHQVTNVFQRIG